MTEYTGPERRKDFSTLGQLVRDLQVERAFIRRVADDVAKLRTYTKQTQRDLRDATQYTKVARRRLFIAAVFTVIAAVWAHDEHIEHCWVGGPESNLMKTICDWTFPGHDHPLYGRVLIDPDSDPIDDRR